MPRGKYTDRLCRVHRGRIPQRTPIACRLFEIGMPRTGSRSVCVAMRKLGLRAVHGFDGCARCEADGTMKALLGRADFHAYRDCDYSGNIAAYHWRTLAKTYPDAQFILTVRPIRDWVRRWFDFKNKMRRHARSLKGRPASFIEVFNLGLFQSVGFNWTAWERAYDRHNREVVEELGDRVLKVNIWRQSPKRLWRSLANFAEVEVPDDIEALIGTKEVTFPHISRGQAPKYYSRWVRVEEKRHE